MNRYRRRDFLADVGRGMLLASVGPALAQDLGLASVALADEGGAPLSFGTMEPLVALMQETPIDRLLPELLGRLRSGTELRALVAAAALANARTFGGQDYDGYHALMALAPAYQMAQELPESIRALPVFKVLYRNTRHIQETGGRSHEVLHPIEPSRRPPDGRLTPEVEAQALRAAMRERDVEKAERLLAGLVAGSLDDAYNDLQYLVQDDVNVHRVVLAWRAWALLDLTGKEQALTLLRQSVRFCVDAEREIQTRGGNTGLRHLLPRLLDQYHLVGLPAGRKAAEDGWVERFSQTVLTAPRDQAAEAAAAALAEGIRPEDVGEGISLAANQLVLRDPGMPRQYATANRPEGSVHGASLGVHASDAANAWRNIARVSNHRNAVASLVVAAYHTAGQATRLNPQPYPVGESLEQAGRIAADSLPAALNDAIRSKDQALACALVHRAGQLDQSPRLVFDLLRRYAVSEDGALHAEKYYRTVTEEFAASRPAFRWRHLAALGRVTASEFGFPAPGYAEAEALLKA